MEQRYLILYLLLKESNLLERDDIKLSLSTMTGLMENNSEYLELFMSEFESLVIKILKNRPL